MNWSAFARPDVLTIAGFGLGVIVLAVVWAWLDRRQFAPKRAQRLQEAEVIRQKIAAAQRERDRATWEAMTVNELLWQLRSRAISQQETLERQARATERIGSIATFWLVLTVLGIIVGCLYLLLR